IARLDCRYLSVESSGLSAAHNAGSEIDKIGTIVYNNGGRGARTIRVRNRRAGPEEHYSGSGCMLNGRLVGRWLCCGGYRHRHRKRKYKQRQHSMSPPTEFGCKRVHTITRDHAASPTEGDSGAIIVIV